MDNEKNEELRAELVGVVGSRVIVASDNTACNHTAVSEKYRCWHGPCVVALKLPHGSSVLRNWDGYARVFQEHEIRERE